MQNLAPVRLHLATLGPAQRTQPRAHGVSELPGPACEAWLWVQKQTDIVMYKYLHSKICMVSDNEK